MATLRIVGMAAPKDCNDWWIIGSAAMILSGFKDEIPSDVDVLASERTAERFLTHWGVTSVEPKPHPHFRSHPFARHHEPGCLPIEMLGDLHIHDGPSWNPVLLQSRVPVDLDDTRVFIPDLKEQAGLLRRFDREKDHRRADLIDQSM